MSFYTDLIAKHPQNSFCPFNQGNLCKPTKTTNCQLWVEVDNGKGYCSFRLIPKVLNDISREVKRP